MKKIQIKDGLNLVTLILVVVVGGAAFFGGIKYQENAGLKAEKSQSTNPFSGRNQFGRNQGGNTGTTNNTQTGVGQRRM